MDFKAGRPWHPLEAEEQKNQTHERQHENYKTQIIYWK